MRRLIVALLVVLLPLQWGWAVASATCGGGGVVSVLAASADGGHAHHHAHGSDHGHGHGVTHGHAHGPSAAADGADDASTPVGDCAVCHLPVAAAAQEPVPSAQACPRDAPARGDATAMPEPPLQRPFRPPMRGA